MNLELCEQGRFDVFYEQTSYLTGKYLASNFLSNMLVSCCQKVLFPFWYFSINLLLLQSSCRWLSGLHSLNWQTYLSPAGLDRNISHSHDAPALGCTSPEKFEYISFKETVCNLF